MKITSVRIKKTNAKNKLLGTASIQLDNCLVIHNIKLLQIDGTRKLSFPNRRSQRCEYDSNGAYTLVNEYSDIVHPSNNEFRKYLEDELFKIYDTESGVKLN